MLFLPKTPQYLMIQKKDAQAEAIIKKLKLSTNVRQTMTDIRLALTEESSSRLCQSENNMNGRMLIGIGLVMAQQLTGTYYCIIQIVGIKLGQARGGWGHQKFLGGTICPFPLGLGIL